MQTVARKADIGTSVQVTRARLALRHPARNERSIELTGWREDRAASFSDLAMGGGRDADFRTSSDPLVAKQTEAAQQPEVHRIYSGRVWPSCAEIVGVRLRLVIQEVMRESSLGAWSRVSPSSAELAHHWHTKICDVAM